MTLLEIRTYYPEAFDRLEVFVDGGFRDGADVLKALCLGATAVGVGRPYYYALAAYGIERCTDSKRNPTGHIIIATVANLAAVLAEELGITMKMLGTTSCNHTW